MQECDLTKPRLDRGSDSVKVAWCIQKNIKMLVDIFRGTSGTVLVDSRTRISDTIF